SNDDGVDIALRYLERPGPALTFANLVDFDSKYGHRNDAAGYARAVEAFDRRLPELLDALRPRDGEPAVGGGLLFLTGDHGCDPTDVSTDHTREYVPVLVWGTGVSDPVDVGTRQTFADLGATVAEALDVAWQGMPGTSFGSEIGLSTAGGS